VTLVETPHKHDWRLWPITSFGYDVICIDCGDEQFWPIAWVKEINPDFVPPATIDHVRNRLQELAISLEGTPRTSDACMTCRFSAATATAEKTIEVMIEHARTHNG
jgi:hypothetical protein